MQNKDNRTEAPQKQTLAIIGSYTREGNDGLHVYQFDSEYGELSLLSQTGGITNPTFLTINKAGDKVYALAEDNVNGQRIGEVNAYSLDKASGQLTFLDKARTSGSSLCHIAMNDDENMLMVSSYGGGSVSSIALKADGLFDAETTFIQHVGSGTHQRQEKAHTHSAFFSPDNRFALVCDLGTNCVYSYPVDPNKKSLIQNKVKVTEMPASSGPRHLAFHPNEKIVYIINELNSTITVCDYDSTLGTLRLKQTISTLPQAIDPEGNITAEIIVSRCGRFVYGSNRGHDSIALFSVNQESGELSIIDHTASQGKHPRNFNIDATGRMLYVVNKDSDNAVSYYIDEDTGRLKPTGHSNQVPEPVCIRFI